MISSIYNEIESDFCWYTISPELPFVHLPSVTSNSCHFELFLDSPESFQSLTFTAFPGTTARIYLFNFIEWIPLLFFKAETNKQTRKNKKRLVHSWPNVVCFSSSKKLHYLQFPKLLLKRQLQKIENHLECSKNSDACVQNLFWETADNQETSSTWKNKKQ